MAKLHSKLIWFILIALALFVGYLYWAPSQQSEARRGAASVAGTAAALAAALHAPGPCLIHATIDREQFVYPMVPPGAANTEMIGG